MFFYKLKNNNLILANDMRELIKTKCISSGKNIVVPNKLYCIYFAKKYRFSDVPTDRFIMFSDKNHYELVKKIATHSKKIYLYDGKIQSCSPSNVRNLLIKAINYDPDFWQDKKILSVEEKRELENDSNDVNIYIDGSCVFYKHIGDGAFVIVDGDNTKEFSFHIEYAEDSSDCENRALLKAFEYLLAHDSKKNINIYYDSNTILNFHTKGPKKQVSFIEKMQKVLYEALLKRGYNISFLHVKAHTGNYYNERADELARNATYSKTVCRIR